MKTVIIATDFSETARNASVYAAHLALALHATLHLVNIAELSLLIGESAVAVSAEDMIHEAEKEIAVSKAELTTLTGGKLRIDTETAIGSVFSELERICEREQPFAVIIGTSGKSGLERALGGAHANYLLRHLPWPVIAVPPHYHFSTIRSIALACDLENVINSIPFGQVKAMVDEFQARLTVLNTGKATFFSPEQVREAEHLRAWLVEKDPEYVFLTGADPDIAIEDFISRHHPDLLVLLPKHHGLIASILHRSHTSQIARHAMVPVMTLHVTAGK